MMGNMVGKLVLYFFLAINLCFAQQDFESYNYSNAELESVLHQIEKDFDVKFSYNSDWIKTLTVNLSLSDPSLNELIVTLERQLHFLFNKVDDRYFILKPINKLYVCGYLKGTNLEPLTGATINNVRRDKITITNNDGYFQLSDVDINDTIQISSLGYKTKRIVSKNFFKKCDDYVLEEKFYNLNEVVIKEYLSSGISLKNNGTVNIDLKNADILAGQAEPDVLQSVQLLPGIDSTTENATDLFIRGSTPDQNLILWDGIKLYNTEHFFGTLTNLNASLVDNVTIYKNGTNAKYGDRVSGVVDIELANEVPKKISASVGANFLSGDLALKIPIFKKIGLIVSARRSFTDFFEPTVFENNFNRLFQNSRIITNQEALTTAPELIQDREFNFEDYSVKIIGDITSKHKFETTLLYTNNKLKDVFESIFTVGLDGTKFTDINFDNLEIENLGISSSFQSKWNAVFETKLNFNHSKFNLNYLGASFDPLLFTTSQVERINTIKEFNLALITELKLHKNLYFNNGYEASKKKLIHDIRHEFYGDFLNNYDLEIAHSFFSQFNFNKVNGTHVDLGIRINKIPTFKKLRFEPRLYAEKKIAKDIRIKTSAEIKYQSINRIDISSGNDLGEEDEIWLPAIKDSLPLVQSKQFSTGFLFKKNNWIVDIDAYYKTLSGLSLFPSGPLNLFQNPREGTGIVKGIDVLIKKKLKKYSTWLGYTYATNIQKFDGINNNVSFNADNDIRHSLTWSHFYEYKNFQFSLGWKYRTGTPYVDITGFDNSTFTNIVASYNEKRVPDYHKLDFSLIYTIKLSEKDTSKNARFGLSIFNVYNQKNILEINRSLFTPFITNEPSELVEFETVSLGTTANFFIRFNF